MILNALSEYYDELAAAGEVPQSGWSREKISYGIALKKDGSVAGIISRKHLNEKGKEIVGTEIVPAHPKKTSGISACFLSDSAAYLLGIDPKEYPENIRDKKQKRARECFEASADLHKSLLKDISESSTAAQSVLNFYEKWNPEDACHDPEISRLFSEFAKTGFLIFTDEMGKPISEYPEIRELWNNHQQDSKDAVPMLCLDTGKKDIPATIHPSIKGIHQAQSSGAALVSFNASAFESYGADGKQGLNAPVSESTVFKYTTVLNKMIADRKNIVYVGDTAYIFWAEKANHGSESIFLRNFSDQEDITDDELRSIYMHLVRDGYCTVHGEKVSYDNKFYVLGIEPNAARLSIHFFWQGKFGDIVRNVQEHDERLEIIQPSHGRALLPLWKIAQETCRISEDENGRKTVIGKPSQPLEDALTRSVITGTRYPMELLTGVLDRIRTNHIMGYSGWEKAAIIKALLLKNFSGKEEVATVSLNRETDNAAYVLGRLFAVLESLQEQSARPTKLNATIRDRYFGSAASTPGIIFPQLLRLAQNHERKLDQGGKVYYDKMITELMGKLNGRSYPMRLSLPDQGAFYLGYYHQRQALFEKEDHADSPEQDKTE